MEKKGKRFGKRASYPHPIVLGVPPPRAKPALHNVYCADRVPVVVEFDVRRTLIPPDSRFRVKARQEHDMNACVLAGKKDKQGDEYLNVIISNFE